MHTYYTHTICDNYKNKTQERRMFELEFKDLLATLELFYY